MYGLGIRVDRCISFNRLKIFKMNIKKTLTALALVIFVGQGWAQEYLQFFYQS